MEREELNLIAATLRKGVTEGTIQPGAVRLFGEALVHQPLFNPADFLRRALPARARIEPTRVVMQHEAPAPREQPRPAPVHGDAAMFVAILRCEAPDIADRIECHYVSNLVGRFSVGRMGASVHVRFGSQAVGEHLVDVVRQAAEEARCMLQGRTTAIRIEGR